MEFPPEGKNKTVSFQTEIPGKVKTAFKSEAAKRGLSMREAAAQALKLWMDSSAPPDARCSRCGDLIYQKKNKWPQVTVCSECVFDLEKMEDRIT